MQRKNRPATRAERKAITAPALAALWDQRRRQLEADDAQTGYLLALAEADHEMARAIRQTRRLPARKRAKELARARAECRDMLREALHRVKHPTIYAERVTGQAMCDISRDRTVPRESRSLAGIVNTATYHKASRRWTAFGPLKRTDVFTLRSTGGRILAAALVAPTERALLADLLAALVRHDPTRRHI